MEGFKKTTKKVYNQMLSTSDESEQMIKQNLPSFFEVRPSLFLNKINIKILRNFLDRIVKEIFDKKSFLKSNFYKNQENSEKFRKKYPLYKKWETNLKQIKKTGSIFYLTSADMNQAFENKEILKYLLKIISFLLMTFTCSENTLHICIEDFLKFFFKVVNELELDLTREIIVNNLGKLDARLLYDLRIFLFNEEVKIRLINYLLHLSSQKICKILHAIGSKLGEFSNGDISVLKEQEYQQFRSHIFRENKKKYLVSPQEEMQTSFDINNILKDCKVTQFHQPNLLASPGGEPYSATKNILEELEPYTMKGILTQSPKGKIPAYNFSETDLSSIWYSPELPTKSPLLNRRLNTLVSELPCVILRANHHLNTTFLLNKKQTGKISRLHCL